MNKKIVEKIREDKELYIFLKYNSQLYKRIFRDDITLKELNLLKQDFFQKTPIHRIKKMSEKIKTINELLEIFKQ